MEEKKEEKKKRGRPKKVTQDSHNEGTEKIVMSSNNDDRVVSNAETITFDSLQKRWSSLYNRYASFVGQDVMQQALNNSIYRNPFLQNQRVKASVSQAHSQSKETIQEAMKAPLDSEQILREHSVALNYENYVYNSLLRLNRDVPCYYSYITPQYVDKKEMSGDSFKKDVQFANKILETFNPQLAFKTINMQVQLEGKCSYLIRKSFSYPKKVDFFLLQKLNPEWIKITGYGSKQQYLVSLNMMLFLNPIYSVDLYPPYIGEIWEEMQANGMVQKNKKNGKLEFIPQRPLRDNHILEMIDNNYFYWVQLEQDDCYTFGQDLSTAAAFPETVGLFLDMKELSDYRWLMGSLMSKSVTSILTASVPLSKDAKAGSDGTIITPDLIEFYTSIFNNTVSNNVLPFFAPFSNYDLHEVDNQPDNMNIVYNRLRDIIATSGNSALMSINDKPSIAMTKAAQAIAASRANYLTLQFQQFLNNIINFGFGLKYQYKVTLWGDNYNSDDLKISKEMLQNGVTSLLPRVLSSKNQSLEDMRCINDYIEVLGIKIGTINMEEENNKGSDTMAEEEKNDVGRRALEDDEIESDATAISRDAGNNVSDIKEF